MICFEYVIHEFWCLHFFTICHDFFIIFLAFYVAFCAYRPSPIRVAETDPSRCRPSRQPRQRLWTMGLSQEPNSLNRAQNRLRTGEKRAMEWDRVAAVELAHWVNLASVDSVGSTQWKLSHRFWSGREWIGFSWIRPNLIWSDQINSIRSDKFWSQSDQRDSGGRSGKLWRWLDQGIYWIF